MGTLEAVSYTHLIDQLLNKKLYLQTLRLVYPIPTHKEKFHTLNYIGTVSDKIGKYFTQKQVNNGPLLLSLIHI